MQITCPMHIENGKFQKCDVWNRMAFLNSISCASYWKPCTQHQMSYSMHCTGNLYHFLFYESVIPVGSFHILWQQLIHYESMICVEEYVKAAFSHTWDLWWKIVTFLQLWNAPNFTANTQRQSRVSQIWKSLTKWYFHNLARLCWTL